MGSSIQKIYSSWIPYQSRPTEELKMLLNDTFQNPTAEADSFFKRVVDDFSEESDIYWLDQAIKYSQYSAHKDTARKYLKEILSNLDRFGFIGESLSAAASYLGMISKHPSKLLADIISGHFDSYGIDSDSIKSLRASAYGAYIMTATNFQTGLDAGRSSRASGENPTLEKAEEVIKKWKLENGKGEP